MITKIHYTPANDVPAKASADVIGGTFVKIAATIDGRNPVIATATAGSKPFGVVAHDAKKNEYVTVYRYGYIVDVATDASIKAGDEISVGANGKAAAAGESKTSAGYAIADAANGYVTVALG